MKKLFVQTCGCQGSGIPGLSEPPRQAPAEDASQVLEALAEGFQAALADA